MNTLLTLAQVRYINQLTKQHNAIIDRINEINPVANWNCYTLRHVLSYVKPTWNYDYKTIVKRLNECIDTAKGKLNRELPLYLKNQAKQDAQQKLENLCNEEPLNGYKFTLNQIRYIYNEYNAAYYKDYDFRDLLTEAVEKELSLDEIITLISNIYNDYISFENFQAGEYYHENGKFYGYDSYVMTMEGDIIEYEDATMCQESDEYTSDPVTLRDGRAKVTIARSVAERNYHECSWDSDTFFNDDALEYYGYYLNDNGEVTDEPPHEEYVREYHSNTAPKFVIFDDNNPYRIGFEIEKEDISVKESIDIDSFEYETDCKWRKEEDGSLSDYSGFELVSPCFSLDPESIKEYITNNPLLVDHINADYSDSCGGHINLSKKDLTGDEFYETIKGYTPLIHALNYDRLGESYCTPASVDKLKTDKRKYQSIAIWGNRIELRVFSAVESVNQLIWRAELMKLICDNPTDDFKTAFYNVHTVLKTHLEEGFNNEYFNSDNHYDDYEDFIDEIITQCKKYENIDLA